MKVMGSEIRATIDYLKTCQKARAAGYSVSLTTDPTWLLDMAIGRRGGWLEDRWTRGITQPVNGKLPRFAMGDAQRHLYQIAQRVNTPRLIVRRTELGEWGRYLEERLPERFTSPGDD